MEWPVKGYTKHGNHHGVIYDSKDGFNVIDCEVCGFKHIAPIPSADKLETIYRHEYYKKEKPLYLKRHREDLDWWNVVYDERYIFFEKNLSKERRKILDVGSGPGYFLLRGKQRGWQVEGIEPSVQAAEHSRSLGLTIFEEFLNHTSRSKLGSYDAVHMSEVLEHIPNPYELLEYVFDLLKPDGMLCVSVPNDYNPLQYVLRVECGFDPWWVAPPHHINYFDFSSMSRLLQRTGYTVIRREASFPMELFLLMGDNYIGNDSLGRQCHGRRKKYEQALVNAGLSAFKSNLGKALAECSIGRTAVIYARRK